MTYSKQQRLEFLRAFQKSNSSIKDFCKSNKISRSNFYIWRKQFTDEVCGESQTITPIAKLDDFLEIVNPQKEFFDTNFHIQLGNLQIHSSQALSHQDFKAIVEILGVKSKC